MIKPPNFPEKQTDTLVEMGKGSLKMRGVFWGVASSSDILVDRLGLNSYDIHDTHIQYDAIVDPVAYWASIFGHMKK